MPVGPRPPSEGPFCQTSVGLDSEEVSPCLPELLPSCAGGSQLSCVLHQLSEANAGGGGGGAPVLMTLERP